ncbi:MAG TPA: hypothetical protein VH599_22225 [Ktedonobacterales bacterium]|jgi:hypothetical protein
MSEQDDLSKLVSEQNTLLRAMWTVIRQLRAHAWEEQARRSEETHVYRVQLGGKGPFRPWTRRDGFLAEPGEPAPRQPKRARQQQSDPYSLFMTCKEVEAVLHISGPTRWRLKKAGKLVPARGNRWYSRKDVEAFAQRREECDDA